MTSRTTCTECENFGTCAPRAVAEIWRNAVRADPSSFPLRLIFNQAGDLRAEQERRGCPPRIRRITPKDLRP